MEGKSWKQLEWGIDYAGYFGSHLNGLHSISETRIGKRIPEVHLWLSVLINAAKVKDIKFIQNYGKQICQWALLDYKAVYKAFEYIWENKNE